MIGVVFLVREDVDAIHRAVLESHGGTPGVLNDHSIQSAVAMPQQGLGEEYFHAFPFGMAAAYIFHLAANHGYADGNKRTGFQAGLAFLALNSYYLRQGEEDGLRDLILDAAKGSDNKDAIEVYLLRACDQRP